MESFSTQPVKEPRQEKVTRFEANKEEILQVHEAVKRIEDFISELNEESREHWDDYDIFVKNAFTRLVEKISEEPCFKFKFATSSLYENEEEVPPYRTEEDSLYFVTENGISLRLKAKNIRYGISEVLQPISEKILFVRKGRFYHTPLLGADVYEIKTSSFSKVILSGKVEGYKPELEMIDGDIESLKRFYFHAGHKIHKIFDL